MPNDEAYRAAKKRGIKKIVTIHPDKKRPHLYMRVYIVSKAGPKGGHTVRGRVQSGDQSRIGSES